MPRIVFDLSGSTPRRTGEEKTPVADAPAAPAAEPFISAAESIASKQDLSAPVAEPSAEEAAASVFDNTPAEEIAVPVEETAATTPSEDYDALMARWDALQNGVISKPRPHMEAQSKSSSLQNGIRKIEAAAESLAHASPLSHLSANRTVRAGNPPQKPAVNVRAEDTVAQTFADVQQSTQQRPADSAEELTAVSANRTGAVKPVLSPMAAGNAAAQAEEASYFSEEPAVEEKRGFLQKFQEVALEVVVPAPREVEEGSRTRRIVSACIACFFALLLTVVGITNLLVPDRAFSDNENRLLAQFPQLTVSSLSTGSFMSGFETSVTDQFVFRDFFVQLKSRILIAMGDTDINNVYICSDGYLISHPAAPNAEVGANNFAAIDAFAASNPATRQFCAFIPRASYTLRENLPKGATFYDEPAWTQAYFAKCTAHNLTNVDTSAVLAQAAATEQVYYRTDHHWTTRGAYAAFGLLAEQMGLDTAAVQYAFLPVSDSFAGTLASTAGMFKFRDALDICVPENPVSVYTIRTEKNDEKTASIFVSEKLKQKNQYEIFFGGNPSIADINTNADSTKTLLVFKDSYANCLISMFTPYYKRIIMVDPRYYMDSIHDLMETNDIDDVLYLFSFESVFNANTIATLFAG